MFAPEFIKVGVITWRVSFTELEEPDWGQCDPSSRTIYIHSNMDQSAQQSTLLHECIHALWTCYGLPEDGNIDEESMVARLEMPLLMLLRDNPELVEWLLS